MEIGRIKWAGHYNSQTGDFNHYGFITRLMNYDDVYFHKDSVNNESKLLHQFNDSDNRYVVFDVVPSPRKTSQFQAEDVRFLEEANAEELISQLSKESLASKTIQQILLNTCPDDPIAYFPLLHNMKIRKMFVDKYETKKFKKSVAAALIEYIEKTGQLEWETPDWKLIDWKKESAADVKKLCKKAVDSGIDVSQIFAELPSIWKDDKTFFASFPFEAIQSLLLNKECALHPEDYTYMFINSHSTEIRKFICSRAPVEWILLSPQSAAYLPENRMASLLNQIQWDNTDGQYITSIAPFLKSIQQINNDKIIKEITLSVEKAWIIEDSPWWAILSDEVKNAVLRDYHDAGLITESNATVNPLLDNFLAQYYHGEQQRDFSVQQKEAIQAVNGVTLLFAVPGSGKTTVLVARAGFMAHAMNISPNKHLIMTYNKAAAIEMKERYKAIFSNDGENIPHFCTIHSFCYNVIADLKERGEVFPKLLENKKDTWNAGAGKNDAEKDDTEKNDNQRKILREIMHKEAYDEDANTLIETVCTLIGFIKNRMLPPEEIKEITYKEEKREYPIEPIYTAYQQYLQRENLMDFDDMLDRAYAGLKKHPDMLQEYQDRYPYVSLDEAQDTSLLQHEIVALLVRKHGNLFMVGDDDQSIYAFRGAVPSEMITFKKRYQQGRKLLMGTNYRSDVDIVKSADRFVQANQKRENKLMRPCSKKQGSIQLMLIPNLSAQYEYITNDALECLQSLDKSDDLAVLFRWNVSAFPVMAYFYQKQIPFCCSKQEEAINAVLNKQEVKRIINLLKYSQNLSDMKVFQEAYFVCYRNIIGKKDLEEIWQHWQKNRNKPVADAVVDFLNAHNLSSKVAKFKENHQKVLSISCKAPRDAISDIIKKFRGEILDQDGNDSIGTWMRVYAVLSAAETCKSIADFLLMIKDMQNSKTNWHESSRKVHLSTMHSAKGKEFGRVIIIDALDDIIPGPETGNDVWYDPEEERRLFYVAITRAKHELDILQVDIYHDRHLKPSRFIGDLHAVNSNVEVVSYSGSKRRSMMKFDMPHYVIRQGRFSGIYSSEDEINEIKKQMSGIQIVRRESYRDAIVYMHKGDDLLQYDKMSIPKDLPGSLTQDIWHLFDVETIEQLDKDQLGEIKRKANLFMATGLTDYRHCAREYALMYLPVNIYKIWEPLMAMLPTRRLPVDGIVKILEIGAGPGTTTLGVLQFYRELAMHNPGKSINIEYFIIEREPTFIEIIKRLVKPISSGNLSVNIHQPICADATDAIKQFAGAEMDLILESNMINPNEHIQEHQLVGFVNDICRAMRNYGSLLLLEPEGPEMMVHLRSIVKNANKTDSLLYENVTCNHASVDLTHMQIVQDVIRKELRVKAVESHGFSYALLERKDVEVRTK